jgi:spore coat polysaccharide biosynthesis predicted glycosyltransferase SpsG
MNTLKNSAKFINREEPIISIGTSGFNSIDLISYVAIEFDFMFDVLSAFQEIQDESGALNLIIKVRPNGVLEQYTAFVNEYFPNLNAEIVREVPISEVLVKTDLYISIYSQTLFEASCLGIPVIYYKKDQEFLDPPFDMKSELVTVDTIAGLKQAFFDFKAGHNRFNAFLEKPVMEKYVGPLDGKNLERNLDFIYGLLDKHNIGVLD